MDLMTVKSLRFHCDRAEDSAAEIFLRQESMSIIIKTVRDSTNTRNPASKATPLKIDGTLIDDDLNMAGRKLSVLVAKEDFSAARELVDHVESSRQNGRARKADKGMEHPIGEMGLPLGVINRLEKHGVMTKADLIRVTCGEIRSWRNVGYRFMEDLDEAASRHSFKINHQDCRCKKPD